MSTLALARSATPALQDKGASIAAMLGRLAEMTGETLRTALADLDRFVRVLDVLTESDADWQRAFRAEVVKALHRLPASDNASVPMRQGMRHMHALIHEHGADAMLRELVVRESPPSWLDLIRIHEPDYRVASPAAVAAREAVKRSQLAHRKTLQRTVTELREEVAELETALRRANWVLERCEADGLRGVIPQQIIRESHRLFSAKAAS